MTRRVAVIGEPFVEAVRPWPGVVLRLLARGSRPVPACALAGPPEERLLALLWHLAARWGHRELDGIALPFALGPRTLGRLTGGRARGARATDGVRTEAAQPRRPARLTVLRAAGRGWLGLVRRTPRALLPGAVTARRREWVPPPRRSAWANFVRSPSETGGKHPKFGRSTPGLASRSSSRSSTGRSISGWCVGSSPGCASSVFASTRWSSTSRPR